MSELDKDFDGLVEQINAKLQEAAKALGEVNELREKAGLDSLIFSAWMREDLQRKLRNEIEEETGQRASWDQINDKVDEQSSIYDQIETDALERELGRAGWSTSSSYC